MGSSWHPFILLHLHQTEQDASQDYANLASSPHNNSILHTIQSSAFVINLDTAQPVTPLHHSRTLWHGEFLDGVPIGLRNRWVDKPAQFIVFDNAYAGFMGEHSVMDGTPTVRLCDDVLEMLHDTNFDHGIPAVSPPPEPIHLDWEMSPTIHQAITGAEKAANELIEGQELGFLVTSYGKAAIKEFRVSPDSWAQMIVQLAYKRLIGNENRIGGTYESATTRKFHKGRTEAIRVVTSESDAWVRSMDDDGMGNEERKSLFDAAAKKHVDIARSAGSGQGVDRHLLGKFNALNSIDWWHQASFLGLKKLIKEGEEMPALFTDPVFLRSSYWVLSTSAVFSKHFPVYGWGEVSGEFVCQLFICTLPDTRILRLFQMGLGSHI